MGQVISGREFNFDDTFMVGEDSGLNGRKGTYSVVTDSEVICLAMKATIFYRLIKDLGKKVLNYLK